MLLEAAIFPAWPARKLSVPGSLEAAELRDALAQNGMPWGRLLHDWAVEHGQMPLAPSIGSLEQPTGRFTVDTTGFYEGLGEISRLCPLEFSMPVRPRGDSGLIDPQTWTGHDLPRMPRDAAREVQVTDRTPWARIDFPAEPLDFDEPSTKRRARSPKLPATATPAPDVPTFGAPSIDLAGQAVGELWVRLEPEYFRALLKRDTAAILRTLSILGEGRLELLRDRLHEQQDQLGADTVTLLNTHIGAASMWNGILENAARQIDGEPDASKRSATAERVLEALRAVVSRPPKAETPHPPGKDAVSGHRSKRTDFLIITALEEERDAVLRHLPGHRMLAKMKRDTYTCFEAEVATSRADGATYRVVVTCLTGMGPVRAATRASDAARRWRPRKVLLVGIAGGVSSQVKLGDVIVANGIADYTLGKQEGKKKREIRWSAYEPDQNLLDQAMHLPESWRAAPTAARLVAGTPRRRFGVVASGGDVIAYDELVARYSAVWPKLVGVEMEGGGVASALRELPDAPGFLMIRGVSDLADASANARQKKRWRAYAADVAAAVAHCLLLSGPLPPASRTKARRTPADLASGRAAGTIPRA